jgi:hypothetical protein
MNVNKIDASIQNLEQVIKAYEDVNIKLSANGGNSVLFICPPKEEKEYIKRMKLVLVKEKYEFIDINELMIKFIDENKEDINLAFELLKSSTSQIFKLPQGEEGSDLFGIIIEFIQSAYEMGKIPTLINVGALNGTDIENIHIMENSTVMKGKTPLVILYPAEKDKDKILFLGLRPASEYRCMVVGGEV